MPATPPPPWSELPELAAFRDAIDDAVTDIAVNPDGRLFLGRGHGMHPVAAWTATPDQVRSLAVRLIARGGRHVDEASPTADVRLTGGVRVHAVLPPVGVGGTALTIRLPSRRPLDLAALETAGMFAAVPRALLEAAVAERRSILIAGGTGAGKTALLGALMGAVDPGERIVTVEDVAELRIDHPDVVALQVRQPNQDGAGAVDLARLVREALRMRPDRIVLGEVRGAEVAELLAALNTGHDGSAGTVHASSIDAVPARLEALGALAGMTPAAVAGQAADAVQLVVQVARTPAGHRVDGVGRLRRVGDRLDAVRIEP